jgi:opacity protein-like surface antigen
LWPISRHFKKPPKELRRRPKTRVKEEMQMRTYSSKVLIAASVMLILSVFSPLPVFAQGSNFYMSLKAGAFFPQTNDFENSENGFNGEVAFGYQFSKNFALEMGAGYFHTGGDQSAAGNISGIDYAVQVQADIDVLPVTLSLKGILPVDKWEFYGIGGIGAYFLWGELEGTAVANGRTGSKTVNDNAAKFGVHLGLGVNYNITPKIFIGAEGKYIWTSETELEGTVIGVPVESTFKTDGIIGTAVLGFRF